MRKLVCLMMCAVLLVCTAGCSAGKPLSPEEYGNAVAAVWKEWTAATTGVVMLIPADTDAPDFLDTIAENYPEAKEYFKTLEDGYDDFEAIVPPEEYAELHKELLSGVKHERTWLKYMKQMFEADNMEDFNSASDKLTAHVNRIAGSGAEDDASLPAAFVNIYMQLKDDGYQIIL